jgi:uncharacterized protein (TIGR00730 family)
MQSAARLGKALAARGITLIYGGGRVGLMGVIADAALANAGRVIGVLPQMLLERELGHSGLTELRVVQTLSERKATMAQLADAFLVLPGGIGTLDELFEMWSWTQLGLHNKAAGLLNVAGYFDPLIQFMDRAVTEGFLSPSSRQTLVVDTDEERLLDSLRRWGG